MGSLRWSRLLAGPGDPWREEPTLQQVCWQDAPCRVISLLVFLLDPAFETHSAVMFLSLLVCLSKTSWQAEGGLAVLWAIS